MSLHPLDGKQRDSLRRIEKESLSALYRGVKLSPLCIEGGCLLSIETRDTPSPFIEKESHSSLYTEERHSLLFKEKESLSSLAPADIKELGTKNLVPRTWYKELGF